jgi:hypothetical protein
MITENLESIFTIAEREKNESRKQELTDLILSGQSLLAVGAGCSIELGYPTWKELIEELAKVAGDCGKDFNKKDINQVDLLQYADEIKEYIDKKEGGLDKFYNHIYVRFSSSKKAESNCTEFHMNLVKLPFKGIFTTNYDRVLESALSAVEFEDQFKKRNPTKNDNGIKAVPSLNPVSHPDHRTVFIDKKMAKLLSDFLLSLDFQKIGNKKCPKGVAHLHGCFDRRESIVLSLQDYISVYNLKPVPDEKEKKFMDTSPSWSLHRKFIWAILATRRSVWIGFSMEDHYIKNMLDMVSRDLWRWNESIHFALMPINSEKAADSKEMAKEFRKKYGFEIVFYSNEDGKHSGLKQFISEVYEKYSKTQERDELINKKSENKKVHINDIIDDQKPKKDSSDWLDSINRKFEKGPI